MQEEKRKMGDNDDDFETASFPILNSDAESE